RFEAAVLAFAGPRAPPARLSPAPSRLIYRVRSLAGSRAARRYKAIDARDHRTRRDFAADIHCRRRRRPGARRDGVALGPLRRDGVLRDDPGGSYRVLRLTECLS